MGSKFKEIYIYIYIYKIAQTTLYDAMINIRNLDLNKIKIDEKS